MTGHYSTGAYVPLVNITGIWPLQNLYPPTANALRFGFINAAHDKLPFGCKLQIVDSEAEIVQNFLASSAGNPLDLANFTDDINDDEEREFVLKVYQEIILKD